MFFRKIDNLSPPITLYYKYKDSHSSPISGILTIFAYMTVISFGFVYILKCLNRENPTIYIFNNYEEDIGTYSFNDSTLFHYIKLINGRFRKTLNLDLRKIEIIGINISVSAFMNYRENFSYWIYDKCENETYMNKIGNLITNNTLDNSACLKKFYNGKEDKYYDLNDEKFEWPAIKHGTSNINTTLYGIIIKKCQNISSYRPGVIKNCASDEEIKKYTNNAFISFSILDHYIDILNYKNPIAKFLYTITEGTFSDSYITNNINFNPGSIKSYDSLFNQKSQEQNSYFFKDHSRISTISQNSNILGTFFIWMQNTQQIYERYYQKLQSTLSEIGGYSSIIINITSFINYLIVRFVMLSDTQDLISFSFKNNKTFYERFSKSQKIKELIVENNQENQNQKIKVFLSAKNNTNKKIINTEISEDSKDENKNNTNKRINVINRNSAEMTNRMNKIVENSQQKIITEQKSLANEEMMNPSMKLFTTSKKEKFNFFGYILYLILCKKINSRIKYYKAL